ncbi:hypothetical protein ACN47E_004975 [Coniothyrium glycines]
MSLVLDNTTPSTTLLLPGRAPWPSPYSAQNTYTPDSSPAPMSPTSLPPYLSHLPATSIPSQDVDHVPSSSWYNPSILAPECTEELHYTSYSHYMPPQTTSVNASPSSRTLWDSRKASLPIATLHQSGARDNSSPRVRQENVRLNHARSSDEPHDSPDRDPWQTTTQLHAQSGLMGRPRSSSGSLHGVSIEAPWTLNPLGIHSPQDSYYSVFPDITCSPRPSKQLIELASSYLASPQPRRIYTSIAPQPHETSRSHMSKRAREDDDDDDDESVDDVKRRKRSDSTTSGRFELSEEDKLLLQLKDEELMPWKDIAARFQADLGKSYQIPALQMRLKRLRERMRVWTETDVRALRMAHEYWTQNKFDIIAQKMLEFGAHERWTARQCARKWTEVEPAPTPYTHHFEQHIRPGFAPYTMSPVESSASYQPYLGSQ